MKEVKKPLVSIIIPAYNVEEYLPDCLDSIISQEYSRIEIIVINDGSTDDTYKICTLYKKKDKRITVINQSNKGLSAARNAGIDRARGEYLAFIDGDDIVSPKFLAVLLDAMNSNHADVGICSFLEFTGRSSNIKGEQQVDKVTSMDGYSATVKLLVGQENRDVIICNKLFKKNLFATIRFPVGKIHEDNLTTYKLLSSATRVVSTPKQLYYYRRRAGSITKKNSIMVQLQSKEDAAIEAIGFFSGHDSLKKAAEISLLLSRFAYLDNIASKKIDDDKKWDQIVNSIKNERTYYMANPFLTKKLKLYLHLIRLPLLYKIFRLIIHR